MLPKSAPKPMAVFWKPPLFKSTSSPRTVLRPVKQPSWHTARACGENAKQASASGIRRKPSRKGDRPINFICEVFIFFSFVARANHSLAGSLSRMQARGFLLQQIYRWEQIEFAARASYFKAVESRVDREVVWLFPYSYNDTPSVLEQVCVPASHTRYLKPASPV